MDKREFLLMLDDVIEADPGTLAGDEVLKEVDGWDSMSVLAFLTEVDQRFGFTLTPKDLIACRTPNDLMDLVQDGIASARVNA